MPIATVVNIGFQDTITQAWAPKKTHGKTATKFFFDKIKRFLADFKAYARDYAASLGLQKLQEFDSWYEFHKFYILQVPDMQELKIRKIFPSATITDDSYSAVRNARINMANIYESRRILNHKHNFAYMHLSLPSVSFTCGTSHYDFDTKKSLMYCLRQLILWSVCNTCKHGLILCQEVTYKPIIHKH